MTPETDPEEWDVERIGTTRDTGDPVMQIKRGGSKMEVIINNHDYCLNVWSVESERKGDMAQMLDVLVNHTGYDWVQFLAPMQTEEKDLFNKVADELDQRGYIDGDVEDSKYTTDEDMTGLFDVLEGFKFVKETHGEKEIPMLVGFWETG